MISPDRLERYKDFVDPERTGEPYDPRKGLERLLGVLSPDPKGIVLAAMGQDWYGSGRQLQSAVFAWLKELGLSLDIWPISHSAIWQYCNSRDQHRETIDGSLVNLGAVVKKAEDPSQILYSRSAAGSELAIPLVQQAIMFVSKAGESIPHKFDSMWRILGFIGSRKNPRKPLKVWEVIDFLVGNTGKHRQIDLQDTTHISRQSLSFILPSLGHCGIIDYISPMTEVEGHLGRGWSVYSLVDKQSTTDFDPDKIYLDVKGIRRGFRDRAYLTQIIDYIKKHPNIEYECRTLAGKLKIRTHSVSNILSSFADLDILQRPDTGFKGSETHSAVSANDLTYLFYDLVCAPAKDVADTLSPLPLQPWEKRKVAIYLENYSEERSNVGIQGGGYARSLLFDILSQNTEEMKLSHITDVYNSQAQRELNRASINSQLGSLLKLGQVEHTRPGYYRLAQPTS